MTRVLQYNQKNNLTSFSRASVISHYSIVILPGLYTSLRQTTTTFSCSIIMVFFNLRFMSNQSKNMTSVKKKCFTSTRNQDIFFAPRISVGGKAIIYSGFRVSCPIWNTLAGLVLRTHTVCT